MTIFRVRSFVALSALTLFVFSVVSALAQPRIPMPRDSQKATVAQTVGVTDIAVTFSRPAVKGRPVFGEAPTSMASRAAGEKTLDDQNARVKGEPIVPFGHLWRTGANEATLFSVNDDVLINGQPLAAGKYSLHTIPGKEEWTIIFNKDDGQWGSFAYDASKDALRVKAKPVWLADDRELLMFYFDPVTADSATVNIRWEKARVPFTIEVKDIPSKAIAKIRTAVSSAKSDDFRTPMQAAGYAKQNKFDADATRWLEQALKAADESIKTKETFANLTSKANILLSLGRRDDAIAVGEKAVARGKSDKNDTAAFEKRLADIKAGKL